MKKNSQATAVERLKLVVAYDGTPFRGWQSQAGGGTVQDHLETAFSKICGARIGIQGAGRTDAGVHATGQCAHADVPRGKMTPEKWTAALNAHLPREIRVMKSARAAKGFHARFSAKGKIYVYRICNGAVLPPLELSRAWHVPGSLDLATLRSVAKKLEGRHDFAAFAANRGTPEKDTVRTIRSIAVRRRAGIITLTFEGDGFLYKMVRLLTGSMARCAQGRAETGWIDALLAGGKKTSFAAPAEGLCLTRVVY